MSKIIVAIDGYSSCGKSTLAKALAQRMGYAYVDSGAMYRCVALYALKTGVIKDKKFENEEIIKLLPKIKIAFKYDPHHKTNETYLNDENVEKQIRTLEVADVVSKVSSIKEVRAHMAVIQRSLGKDKGVVMDGRDIGSHIFPNAELKIFMTADPDVRVQRRMDEMNSKGMHVEKSEVKTNLLQRDYDDTHRKENPLVKAKDAIVLDNSELSKEEQLEFVVKLITDLTLTSDSFV